MEISALSIYLLGLALNISCAINVICILLTGIFSYIITCTDPSTVSPKCCRRLLIILLIAWGINIVTPSKETILAMVTLPPVLNNEQVQELPENIVKFANKYLKEHTEKFE